MKKGALILTLISLSLSSVFSQAIIKTNISSDPSGASIYVDGSYIGQTPTEFRFRDGKVYRIELRKDNYYSESFNHRGGTGNINRRLDRIPPPKPTRNHNKMASPSYEDTRRHDNRSNERHEEPRHKPHDREHDKRKGTEYNNKTKDANLP